MADEFGTAGENSSEFSQMISDITQRGLKGLEIEEQLSAFAKAICVAGFPMKRTNMGMSTLHPRYGALNYIWRPEWDSVESSPQGRTAEEREAFAESPIHFMLETGTTILRFRLDNGGDLPYSVLKDLKSEGMTDYAAHIVEFSRLTNTDGVLEGVFFSCATDAPGGFDPDQLKLVLDALPYLAMAIKSRLTYSVASTITETYLGADAGSRVLTGEIERGACQAIDAVIWFCDLRGFTQASNTLERDTLIRLLNDYLEVMARPVREQGGQILKFMGDGFLATFELKNGDDRAACDRALQAAKDLRAYFAALNRQRETAGEPVLNFGLALHIGEVLYGNIGADGRLDFTVVGPAVNAASRIQDLCRPLEKDVILSERFGHIVGVSPGAPASLGTHPLRGVPGLQELFALET